MEIGPRDMKARTARLVRRDTNEKSDYQWDQLASAIPRLLEDIHQSMFSRAKRNLNDSIVKVSRLVLNFLVYRGKCMRCWLRIRSRHGLK